MYTWLIYTGRYATQGIEGGDRSTNEGAEQAY